MKAVLIALSILSLTFCSVEINNLNVKELVYDDENVWVIKIASRMCSSCQEFADSWESVEKSTNELKFGIVHMEDPEGMNFVNTLPDFLMEDGLPIVIVYLSRDNSFKRLIHGNVIGAGAFKELLTESVKQLYKGSDGIYKKAVKLEL